MNHNPANPAVDNAADGLNIHAFLQQAVDHYPRLAAFSFTVLLPHSETMEDNRVLIFRFHTEVWQRIGEYLWQRQQARRNSPPTILRWIWESVGTAECKMVLLMNLDTLGAGCDEVARQVMSAIIDEAWRTATEADKNVASMSFFIISRSDKCSFTQSFNQLRLRVDEMASPVMAARTGVICPCK